jgi:hypothetical protein
MEAIIRTNPEETLVEFDTPDGEYDPVEWPEDGLVVLEDDKGSPLFLAVLEEGHGLKANTVYQLTEITTVVEESDDVVIEGEEEDEEEEDEPEVPGTDPDEDEDAA